MKKIGFLSFGHWTPSASSQTRSAGDALLQSIDLAVAAWTCGYVICVESVDSGVRHRVRHACACVGVVRSIEHSLTPVTSRMRWRTARDYRYEEK